MKATKANAAESLLGKLKLYAYQKRWIRDHSRFKIAAKARQIGWTFAAALRVVLKRLKTPGLTVWISASDRQALEAMEHIRRFVRIAKLVADYQEIDFDPETKVRQVTLPNGSRIIALPANPDTIRGFSGDVVMDEFAFHRDAEAIWRAAFAIATRGFQLEVISSPNGARGRFHDLAKASGLTEPSPAQRQAGEWKAAEVWSVHWCDIYKAVVEGAPLDIKALRAAALDDDTWLQVEEVIFLSDADHYFPLELVIACESVDATLDLPEGFVARGPLYLGQDVGRKKDLSVIWLWELLGDVLWTRMVKVMARTPFHVQQSELFGILPGVVRGSIDATGIGAMLAEEAVRKFGSKVEAVDFNIANKEMMVTATKRLMEERRLRLPFSPLIRHAFGAIKRFLSTTGHARFDAERSELGHADPFWGAALGVAAAQGPAISVELLRGGLVTASSQLVGYRRSGAAHLQAMGY